MIKNDKKMIKIDKNWWFFFQIIQIGVDFSKKMIKNDDFWWFFDQILIKI